MSETEGMHGPMCECRKCGRALRERALVLDPRPSVDPIPDPVCAKKCGGCFWCLRLAEREAADGYPVRFTAPILCEAPGYNMVIQLDDDPGPFALGWRAWGGPTAAKRSRR
jgi:hypothetical protein